MNTIVKQNETVYYSEILDTLIFENSSLEIDPVIIKYCNKCHQNGVLIIMETILTVSIHMCEEGIR